MATLTSSDGLSIAYAEWGHESALPPVILHHGFAASGKTNWQQPGVIDALIEAGRRVITIDARGHGDSSKPHDPAYYGEGKMSSDVRALADLLGLSSFDLVGYSMGAIVSLIVASQDARVRRLVVGGIGAAVVEQGGVDRRALGAGLIDALKTDEPSSITNQSAAAFRAFAEVTGADRLALAAHAAAVHQDAIDLDKITAETQVLVGDQDTLAARPRILADAIPNAQLNVLSGDHLGVVRVPEFTKLIVTFLAVSG